MTCPECGTNIGVFRRKFSNTAYCSEACRQTARQKQNQASLALLLSNKNRHLAQLQAAAAPPLLVEALPEPEFERAREAVHSGVLAGFAPFQRPSAHRAPAGGILRDEEPAAAETEVRLPDAVLPPAGPALRVNGWMAAVTSVLQPPDAILPVPTVPAAAERDVRFEIAVQPAAGTGLRLAGWVDTATRGLRQMAGKSPDLSAPAAADWGARWQGVVQQGLRLGFGVTGWILTAMSCMQPLVAAMPTPCGELTVPFATIRERAGDRLHPVWDPPAAEPAPEPEPEAVAGPLPWMVLPPTPARLAAQWFGLSAAREWVSPLQWRPDNPPPAPPAFALYGACRPAPKPLPAGPPPGCAVDGAPLALNRLPAPSFEVQLEARSPQPPLAEAGIEGLPWCRQAPSPPDVEALAPARWIGYESGELTARRGKLLPASWARIPCSASTGDAVIKTNSETMRWRFEARRSNGDRLLPTEPNWNLLQPPVAEAVAAVTPEAAIAVPAPVLSEAAVAPSTRPVLLVKDRLAGLRESIGNFPAWTKRAAFHIAWLLPLALVSVWFGPGIRASSSGAIPAQWVAVKSAIERRATVDLEDDFRGGLSHWNGTAGWAKTWSYDATGLLHPGALALYLESAGMGDYSLEFLGVIEKRALGWTYRTVDMSNYYATRLALTRRGNIPTLDLERYAVINGRPDRRVQLPLPVVLSNITSFRVRTEVRGSRFTTYLNGKIIDAWSDDRLTHGGIGFFTDPDAVVGLQWVRVIQGDDLIGRLCAQVSSAFADKKLREALH